MTPVQAFWCDSPNFGDALNRLLFAELGGFDLVPAPEDEARVAGIGSVLDRFLADAAHPYFKRRPIAVFSSGFGFDEGENPHLSDVMSPEHLRRAVRCFAVRGHKTAARLKKLVPGLDVGVIGDGGLLVSRLVGETPQKLHAVGIVPHYADREDEVFRTLAERLSNAVILDPREGVIPFLRHLQECETVISTAMHPLIACDALGIPNQWVRISEQTTSRYKFEDYYSIYGFTPEPLDPRRVPASVFEAEAIRARYRIPAAVVAEKQRELFVAFQSLCCTLRRPCIPFPPPFLVKAAATLVPGREHRRALRTRWLYEYC